MSDLGVSLILIPDGGELCQQLAALSVGEKLKLTVEDTTENGATFRSDDLNGATVLANKHHVEGTY